MGGPVSVHDMSLTSKYAVIYDLPVTFSMEAVASGARLPYRWDPCYQARVGLLPTWGLSVRLPQKVGVGVARRMSMTGDYLSAQDALRAGLVTEVVAQEQLLAAAREVAASIVGNNQSAVRALLASYHRIDESQTSDGLWLEAAAARQFRTSGDDIAANREAVLQRGRAQVR